MKRGRSRKLLWIAGAVVLFLVVTIDDWRRDFTTNHAEIGSKATGPPPHAFVAHQSAADLVEALKWAARRIGSWEYVGTTAEGTDTLVLFVRTSKIFQLKNDVRMYVRDRGNSRLVFGESRSRWGAGDLGQNPRNLREILAELKSVLEGTD